jgi:hypothetical protein
MQKTVVVAVSYVVWVPKYKVYEKRVGRHMVCVAMQRGVPPGVQSETVLLDAWKLEGLQFACDKSWQGVA